MNPAIGDPNPGRRPRNCAPSGRQQGQADPEFKPGTWGLKSSSTVDTLRITTCKLCPCGVYKGQAKVWGNGIDLPIGWSHEGCAERHAEVRTA